MGWSSCGDDSRGRPIGYAHRATCDHPGCKVEIDRGLSYACGGMHGGGEGFCEDYFCQKHLFWVDAPDDALTMPQVCEECMTYWQDGGEG